MWSRKAVRRLAIITLPLAAALAACGNPVKVDLHDEHAEVDGLRVVFEGVELYRVLEGDVGCAQEPCGIDVNAGEENGPMAVEFLDHDGHEIHGEDLDDEFVLGIDVADSNIVSFTRGSDESKWSFRVKGLQPGETHVRLHLYHGGEQEHPDISTPPLDSLTALTVRVGGAS